MTGIQIAELIKVPERTVYSWLVWFDIPRRNGGVEHWSEEQKIYRREWNKAHPEINHMRGKRHSKQTRDKMSKSRQGPQNSNWRGGLTAKKRGLKRSPEYYQWRKMVLRRDNEICQKCHIPKSKQVHHIQPFKEFPSLRFDVSNGLTLCLGCHKNIHSQGGVPSNIRA